MDEPLCDRLPNTRCRTILTRGETVGVVLVTEAGMASVIAVLVLFYKILRNAIRNTRSLPDKKRIFFRSPLDIYMLSLFISDLIQGVGVSLGARSIAEGIVKCGSYCTAQGVLLQLGETSVAMATLAIAVHTFITIFFRRQFKGLLVPTLVVLLIWLYVIIFIAVSIPVQAKNGENYITPTPYWCWVAMRFFGERIAGEYFWFWFTALGSLVLYLLIFLCLRGNIEFEEGQRFGIRFRLRRPENRPQDTGASRRAFDMLLYPIAYCGLILPLSIVRWISFVLEAQHPQDPNDIHHNIPPAATFVAQTIFCMSGVVNVVLILSTRPGLLLVGEPAEQPALGPIFASSGDLAESIAEPQDSGSLRMRSIRSTSSMIEAPDVISRPS